MTFRWKSKKFRAVAVVVVVLGALAIKWIVDWFGVPVVLSKETTYITEPLRKDGLPDYLAALNQRNSKDVTPENNAAVLFWRAMGPETIYPTHRAKFFQMLGIPALPENGAYFVTLDAYLEASSVSAESLEKSEKWYNERYDKMMPPGSPPPFPLSKKEKWNDEIRHQYHNDAQCRPWSKKEFPVLADWLAANEKPLDLLIQASRLPRCYNPIVDDGSLVLTMPLYSANNIAVRVLTTRAMLRIGENRVDDAWSDLLACHRMTRQIGREQRYLCVLQAINIERDALAGEHALLQHASLTAAQIAKMRDDLAHLPPMLNMADVFDVSSRYMGLDYVMAAARHGTAVLEHLIGEQKPARVSVNAAIDWNIPLRMCNSWYDRIVAAMRKPTRAECLGEYNTIESNLLAETNAAQSWSAMGSAIISPQNARSKLIGLKVLAQLMPTAAAACDAEDRITMQRELNDLAFALAAYRADHGSYPKTLAELTPKYVSKVPKDLSSQNSNDDLHYRVRKDGFLLYSVGINGKDDGGKSHDDRSVENYDPDNLTVRVNWPTQ